jgi:hypothetical protein
VLREIEQLPSIYNVVTIAKQYVTEMVPSMTLDSGAKKEIARAGLARAEVYASEGHNAFTDYEESDAMILVWRWRDLYEFLTQPTAPLQRYLKSVVEMDPRSLLALLQGMSASRGEGLVFALNFTKHEMLKSLEQILGVSVLRDICDAYRPRIGKEDDPDDLITQCLAYLSVEPAASS